MKARKTMDNTIRNELILRLKDAKNLEARIALYRQQEEKIKELLASGHDFEINIKIDLGQMAFTFCTDALKLDSLPYEDLKENLQILLCSISKKLHTLENEYRQL